jgi:chorismate dehydratase
MELVIGDEALQRRHEFWKVLDLGKIWLELTGLPFVFGLWQTSSQVLPSSIKYLVAEAASIAQARMRVEPGDYFPESMPLAGDGKDVDLAGYWKVIQYKLTERHLCSLLLYFSLYQRTCGRVEDESITERFVRWSKIWTGAHSIAVQ